MQRAHDDGISGICNHTSYDTVYSYVLRRRHGSTTLYVAQGRPCAEPPRIELVLPLGDRWTATAAAELRAAYPSGRTMVDA